MSASVTADRPWRAALLWLLFLGPFFFATYGAANHFTAARSDVGICLLPWDSAIPFLPWTIIPYWSIDLFYGLSLLVCTSRQELDTHARRLALATVISVAGFLLFPLRFSFPKPETHGLFKQLFDLLGGFDLPYNQAPSLHVSLLLILWLCYARHTPYRWLPLLHGWFALIGVSVLTTYQHHSIDVITGFFVGLICCYALPDSPPAGTKWQPGDPAGARTLAIRYTASALVFCGSAIWLGGLYWVLLWPAVALGWVAAGYAQLGPAIFQKTNGQASFAARWLLLPYRIGARISWRLYLRKIPPACEVVDGIWIGPYPRNLPAGVRAVLDLSGEFDRARASFEVAYAQYPLLDLIAPHPAELTAAAVELERLRNHGPVLVHCALGLSRSAIVVAAWLVQSGQARDGLAALDLLRARRPVTVLHLAHHAALASIAPAAEST